MWTRETEAFELTFINDIDAEAVGLDEWNTGEIDEQKLFVDTLHHDKRGGTILKVLRETDPRFDHPIIRQFASKDFSALPYTDIEQNTYVTVNAFRGRSRKSKSVYCYNALYFDLDGHDFSYKQLQGAMSRTAKILHDAVADGKLSAPTMITCTGRGLGVYYVLEHSIAATQNTAASVKFLHIVWDKMLLRYKELLSGPGLLDVDASVGDTSRICRLPLTLNRKSGTYCRLIHIEKDPYTEEPVYYNLHQLVEENNLFPIRSASPKKEASKKTSLASCRAGFFASRLSALEKLQKLRGNCCGTRELMCFAYYNASKQGLGDAAGKEATKKFNTGFSSPLDSNELDRLFKGIDSHGAYAISNQWLIKTLNITPAEEKAIGLGSVVRTEQRRIAKQSTAQKRLERNNKIINLIINSDKTYKEIGAEFGVSEITVKRIAKEANIRRNNLKKASRIARPKKVSFFGTVSVLCAGHRPRGLWAGSKVSGRGVVVPGTPTVSTPVCSMPGMGCASPGSKYYSSNSNKASPGSNSG